jgi:hypothetical protein
MPPLASTTVVTPIALTMRASRLSLVPGVLAAAESRVRTGLGAGGNEIRTLGPYRDSVTSFSRRRRGRRSIRACKKLYQPVIRQVF